MSCVFCKVNSVSSYGGCPVVWKYPRQLLINTKSGLCISAKYRTIHIPAICIYFKRHFFLLKYRASTITGHTVYFTKRTGHLKMRYSQFFHSQNIINTRNYILNIEKIEENAFLNVLCVLWSKQCVQCWWIPCNVQNFLGDVIISKIL